MMVINPKKRITIDQILSHPLLKPFRKQQEEIVSDKKLRTSIDDNKKLGVDDYRKMIYKGRKCVSQAGSPRNLMSSFKGDEKYFKSSKTGTKDTVQSQTLTKMQSCKNILMDSKGSEKDLGSSLSWKDLVNNPSEALRMSAKLLRKTDSTANLKTSQTNKPKVEVYKRDSRSDKLARTTKIESVKQKNQD